MTVVKIAEKTNADSSFLHDLMVSDPQLAGLLEQNEKYQIQVIYTQIDRKNNKKRAPALTHHYFNRNAEQYFYPASTVKFPVAVLALQKLNELDIKGLNKYSTMITGTAAPEQTEVLSDSTAKNGKPSIAHYIKKILLVSDNDAFNRLYEFLGQDYINHTLQRMGYTNTEIIHRLSISLSEEQNRHTNPVNFYDEAGKQVYSSAAQKSTYSYTLRNPSLGKGFMQNDQLVNMPFDFSKKNRLPLQDLHEMLTAVMFPESIEPLKRFRLTKDDYDFLRKYMSMNPPESNHPVYDKNEYWENYVRFIYYGSEKTPPEKGIRIFGKTGTAYGFLIESSYFADFNNKIEFILSAVIYCNSDGIFNDDKYDYDTIGYPFFKKLGKLIYDYELKRKRKHPGNPSSFVYNYSDQN